MKQDAEMTKAKKFLKTLFNKENGNLVYPAKMGVVMRRNGQEDLYRTFLASR